MVEAGTIEKRFARLSAGRQLPSLSTLPAKMPTKQLVVHFDETTFNAEVDTSQTIEEIIASVLQSRQTLRNETPSTYFLSFYQDSDRLDRLTVEGLRRCRVRTPHVQLVPLPMAQVEEAIYELQSPDHNIQKQILQQLPLKFQNREFAEIFVSKGGISELITEIHNGSGATLAGALASFQFLLDTEGVWKSIDDALVARLLELTVSIRLTSIARPCFAIMIRLLLAEKHAMNASHGRHEGYNEGMLLRGIEAVEDEISSSLISRLDGNDQDIQLLSLGLINALLSRASASEERLDQRLKTGGGLEDLILNKSARRAVQAMQINNPSDEAKRALLDYQRFYVAELGQRRNVNLDLTADPNEDKWTGHGYRIMRQILREMGISCDPSQNPLQLMPWKKMGVEESFIQDIQRSGLLGLENLLEFLENDGELWSEWNEQTGSANDETLPFSAIRASIECTEILSDVWGVSTGVTASATLQLPLLSFEMFHGQLLRKFQECWLANFTNSEADATRLTSMMRSHARRVLFTRDEERPRNLMQARSQDDIGRAERVADRVSSIKKSLLNTNINVIRDQYARDLEDDADLMSRPAIRRLKDNIYRSAFEFIKQQRIDCLKKGAWFEAPAVSSGQRDSVFQSLGLGPQGKSQKIPMRFVQLSSDCKFLCWELFADIVPEPPRVDDLEQRVDMSSISDIVLAQRTGASPAVSPMSHKGAASLGLTRASVAASGRTLTFTLLSESGNVILSLPCKTSAQYSEWTDGLSFLLDRAIVNRDTSDFVNSLAEMEMKVHLLDLSSESESMSSSVTPTIPPIPACKNDYFYGTSLLAI